MPGKPPPGVGGSLVSQLGDAHREIERLRALLLNTALAMGADSKEFRDFIGMRKR